MNKWRYVLLVVICVGFGAIFGGLAFADYIPDLLAHACSITCGGLTGWLIGRWTKRADKG